MLIVTNFLLAKTMQSSLSENAIVITGELPNHLKYTERAICRLA